MRFTEYHNGIAVIKDKSLLKEAMRKLAGYEDVEEDSDMEKLTTALAEYVCDDKCFFREVCGNQEHLDEICDECKLGKFICDICNRYNKLNTFVGSQVEILLKKNSKLEKELKRYEDLEEQGLLLRLPCKVGTKVWTIMTGMTGKHPMLFRQEFEVSMLDHWGKAVFLTKAEAEKALAEMEKQG